jgi:putative transposase
MLLAVYGSSHNTGKQELKIQSRHHCVYALNYHLVLVTKYRRRCLTAAMLSQIQVLAQKRCAVRDGELIECNGEADHVHLLVSLPPHVAVSEFVNALKTNTARLLRRDFPKELARWYKQPVLWSRSYCAISVGGAPLDVLKRYIEQQDAPH